MPKVLIIYTGGTIGMITDVETGSLTSVDFDVIDKHVPELKRLNIEIDTHCFAKPVDSSEINSEHWIQIADVIESNYDQYDGFVILHGSDTMSYTASALSFMLEGLSKPVLLTGSQLPIGTIRTDGKENIITALQIACDKDASGKPRIQEVAIYFEYYLYRGNRSTKDSANLFKAFRSPNLAPLAVAGVDIDYKSHRHSEEVAGNLTIHRGVSNRIALIKLFPGMNMQILSSAFDREHVDGIVMETFGSGNAPTDEYFQELCTNFTAEGGLILNITQCASGKVQQGKYATSEFFAQAGIISGADMTTEAAVTKMMHLLGNYSIDAVRSLMRENLRGELTD